IGQRASHGTRSPALALRATCTILRQSRLAKCVGGGSSTSEGIAAPLTYLHHCLRRLADGSRAPTPGGSLPAFAWGGVATPIRPPTGGPSLAPPSFPHTPVGSPCGSLPRGGGLRAAHVAPPEPAWVRPRLYAGGSTSAWAEFGAAQLGPLPFWSRPDSTFGLSSVTTLAAVHLG